MAAGGWVRFTATVIAFVVLTTMMPAAAGTMSAPEAGASAGEEHPAFDRYNRSQGEAPKTEGFNHRETLRQALRAHEIPQELFDGVRAGEQPWIQTDAEEDISGQDCRPHPPIRITENEGPQGFILGHAPNTGDPVYRPGSGVVDGEGTAEDPYVIEGWCITPQTPSYANPLQRAGILIEDTDAHVVVRDTVVAGETVDSYFTQQSVGIELSEAENVSIRNATIADNWLSGIILEDSEAAIQGSDLASSFYGVVLDRSQAAINDSQVANVGIGAVSFMGDTTLLDNTVQDSFIGVVLFLAEDATLRNNALGSGGLLLLGDKLAHYQHTIADTNTVNGDPLRYVRGQSGVTVDKPAGQVVLVNTEDANVEGLDLSGTVSGLQAAYTNGTTVQDNTIRKNLIDGVFLHEVRQATVKANVIEDNFYVGAFAIASQATIEANSVEEHLAGIVLLYGSQVTMDGNTIGESFYGVFLYESESTIRNNTITYSGLGVLVYEDSQATIEENTIDEAYYDGVILYQSDADIRNNTIQDNGAGIYLIWSTATVEKNVLAWNDYAGVVTYDSPASVNDNNIHDNDDYGLDVDGNDRVDATDNWWGADSGPSGGVEDACTGAVADGGGDAINVDDDAEVCFDPWRSQPVDGAGA